MLRAKLFSDRGVRHLEQLVVRRSSRRPLQRPLPGRGRGAHPAAGGGPGGRGQRGAVRAAGPPALWSRRLARRAVVRCRHRDKSLHGTSHLRLRDAPSGRDGARPGAGTPWLAGERPGAAHRVVQPRGGPVRRPGRCRRGAGRLHRSAAEPSRLARGRRRRSPRSSPSPCSPWPFPRAGQSRSSFRPSGRFR